MVSCRIHVALSVTISLTHDGSRKGFGSTCLSLILPFSFFIHEFMNTMIHMCSIRAQIQSTYWFLIPTSSLSVIVSIKQPTSLICDSHFLLALVFMHFSALLCACHLSIHKPAYRNLFVSVIDFLWLMVPTILVGGGLQIIQASCDGVGTPHSFVIYSNSSIWLFAIDTKSWCFTPLMMSPRLVDWGLVIVISFRKSQLAPSPRSYQWDAPYFF